MVSQGPLGLASLRFGPMRCGEQSPAAAALADPPCPLTPSSLSGTLALPAHPLLWPLGLPRLYLLEVPRARRPREPQSQAGTFFSPSASGLRGPVWSQKAVTAPDRRANQAVRGPCCSDPVLLRPARMC